ncbi:MAG: hypothetical protein RhofKO_21640 [Rhodothermales bacterium]
MDRYLIYNLLHLIGVMGLFLSLGGMFAGAIQHKASSSITSVKSAFVWWRPSVIMHGISMFLILLGGFGMLARLGIAWPWPIWIFIKLFIWFVLGGILGAVARNPSIGGVAWYASLLLGALAAFLCTFKMLFG